MAVVDSIVKVQDIIQKQSLFFRNKIESTTAQAKSTVAKGVLGYYFGTGIISACAFSLIIGSGFLLGTLVTERPWGPGLGFIAIGGILLLSALVGLYFLGRGQVKK